jgi:hypothetical protein
MPDRIGRIVDAAVAAEGEACLNIAMRSGVVAGKLGKDDSLAMEIYKAISARSNAPVQRRSQSVRCDGLLEGNHTE